MKELARLLSFDKSPRSGTARFNWDDERFEIPRRDSQRQKVYDAERRAFPQMFRRQLPADHDQMQAVIDAITQSAFWRKLCARSRRIPRKVELVRAKQRNAWANSYSISIPIRMRSVPLLLHELAHAAAPVAASHHWVFCAIYLELVRHYMGNDWAKKLRAEFKAERVRYTPKRKRHMSEEQKEALRERLATARAARKSD